MTIAFLLTAVLTGLLDAGHTHLKFQIKTLDLAIGIYTGDSPTTIGAYEKIPNPVLTAENVTDRHAEFLADPFMVREKDTWYLFFEVMNAQTQLGEIGLAESPEGLKWHYKQIVLNESFHMSYPYVFKFQNDYYMVPETYQASEIRLYKAVKFPTHWTLVKVLLKNQAFKDTSLFQYQDKWWLLTETSPVMKNDTLRLHFADQLTGPWHEHPKSPVISRNPHIARPAGRVLVLGDKILRFAQDDFPTYGLRVRAFEITDLSETAYAEKEIFMFPGVSLTGRGWNADGMHNIDLHQLKKHKWIACVDGFHEKWTFPLKESDF